MSFRSVIAVAFLIGPVAAAAEGERDWTIEKPVLSGFISGLSLGLCQSCRLGSQGRPASDYDPFAMSPAVKSELKALATTPHRAAQAAGAGYTAFVIGGLFFRRLNRLEEREALECGD